MGWDDWVLGKYSWNVDGNDVLYGAVWLDDDADWNNEKVDIDEYEGDVRTVTVHEIGHLNGWRHRCEADYETHEECDTQEYSVMAAGVDGTKRWISSYDEG